MVLILGAVALIGFAALSVDLAYMHYKRSGLQKAADAAAMAGAASLLSHRGDLPAVQDIVLEIARANLSEGDEPEAAVTAGDVNFFVNGNLQGDADEIEVSVRRVNERANPVGLFFGRVLGRDSAEIGATARAGITFLCSSRCVKPFIVPTKFDWDDFAADPNSKYYGNGELDVDSSEEMASVDVLGYGQEDVGTRVTLKFGDPKDTIVPSHYNAVDYPPVNKGDPVTGASAYSANIAGCDGSNRVLLELGDELYLEPGNMTGPTDNGLSRLIDQDPFAYWDDSDKAIKESAYDNPLDSPRVSIIAFYDPRHPPTSGRNTLKVYQLGAVFVEDLGSQGEIQARFINAVPKSPGPRQGNCLLAMPRMTLDSSRTAN
jgi:hypothetical protein